MTWKIVSLSAIFVGREIGDSVKVGRDVKEKKKFSPVLWSLDRFTNFSVD